MTGNDAAALIVLVLSVFPATSITLLAWYLITGNDRPFLRYYGFLFGVKFK